MSILDSKGAPHQVHCVITQDTRCMTITPCSAEPTFVNGTRIPDTVPLRVDDIITVGQTFQFQFVQPGPLEKTFHLVSGYSLTTD